MDVEAHTSGVASPNDRSKLGKSLSTDNHEGALSPDAGRLWQHFLDATK